MAILESTDRLHELALFAGGGGGILAGRLLGWRTVCAVEFDQYAASVLVARQNDGCLEPFPIWDDVRTFDGRLWRGRVDVVSGGFPCQDISAAGKGAGIDGERSGLWSEFARIIGEVRPRFAFVENSPRLARRGLGRVLGDLAGMGYDTRRGVVSAAAAGMDHLRRRMWIIATDAVRAGLAADLLGQGGKDIASRARSREERQGGMREPPRQFGGRMAGHADVDRATAAWKSAPCEPLLLGVSGGNANWMDRIKATGNAQVPSVARLAWRILTDDALSCSSVHLA